MVLLASLFKRTLSLTYIFFISSLSLCTIAEEGNLTPDKKTDVANKTSKDTPTPSNENGASTVKILEPIDRFALQQSDIKHYIVNENVTSLLVGTEEYLSIITPYKTEINKGVMILMPDWQKGITSPGATKYLSKQLPFDGWTTIAVHPPAKPQNYPSSLLDETARIEENKKVLTDYQLKIADLMRELMKKAEDYPGVFIVVAQGSLGAVLMNHFQTPKAAQENANEKIKLPHALVLMSAHLPTEIENTEFAMNVASSDLPILDLHLKKDQQHIIESAKQRAEKVKNELKAYYRQQTIFNTEFSYYPDSALRASLLGWLKTTGW